ncbi:MAG: hypothetical protein R2764_24565 [Bacteroidales bacterium]
MASNIHLIKSKEVGHKEFFDFRIVKSENSSEEITDISPDIAVCDEWLTDLKPIPPD